MKVRDKNFLKQIKASLVFRVLTILLSFVLVRKMLDYLGVEQYGIWSIILSFMTWILFFDLGIANGVKNKVSESLALNKKEEARSYISTGYIILALFSIIVYSIFYTTSYYLQWQNIFNIETVSSQELGEVLRAIVFFILLNFTLSVATAVYTASQNASLIVINQFLSNLFALISVFILVTFTNGSLLYMAIAYGMSLVLSNILLSFYFYFKNGYLSPKLKLFDQKKVKNISSLGMKFFLLQLVFFFIVATDKILITQLLGPSYVSSYDVLYKYFGSILILHTIFNTPLWSMYTEAYVKNDYQWMSKTIIKMSYLFFAYIGLLTIMILLADIIFELWLGKNELAMSSSNYIYMSIMVLFLAWHATFSFVTNGVEKLKIQFYSILTGAILNIPLSIYFVKTMNMGLNGVILATIISLSIFGILGPIQSIKIISDMKKKEVNEI